MRLDWSRVCNRDRRHLDHPDLAVADELSPIAVIDARVVHLRDFPLLADEVDDRVTSPVAFR
jgi:hypothetical protein